MADLASISAIREVSVSIALALVWGDANGGVVSPGHPTTQATAIISPAVTAPVTAATSIAEMILGKGHANDRLGWAPAPAPWVSPDTSVASRSMVGGGRLARPESGGGEASSALSSSITTVPLSLQPKSARIGASLSLF
jgi:hypothetical protein